MTATELRRFDARSLRAALVYHRVYHYTASLHANHLVFLHSYLLGVFLLLASPAAPQPWLLVCGSCAYIGYVVWLTRDVISLMPPYVVLLAGIAAAAWRLGDLLADVCALGDWLVPLAAVALILGSFIAQLLGHAAHEAFFAPPSLQHGFLAAPPLESPMRLESSPFLPHSQRACALLSFVAGTSRCSVGSACGPPRSAIPCCARRTLCARARSSCSSSSGLRS